MSVQAVKRRLNLEVGPSQTTFKAPRGKRKRSITGHTPTKGIRNSQNFVYLVKNL